VLEKPKDTCDARRMLQLLSGRDHLVHTGICLLSDTGCLRDLATTRVYFATLTEKEISEYTQSGEPADKAGAYAIQGLASKFVVAIEGSYGNVVGLPVALVYQHLKALSA
jgi:septum formation protein